MTCKRIVALICAAASVLLIFAACGKADADKSMGYSSPTKEELAGEVDFEEAEKSGTVYTSEDGMVVIPAAAGDGQQSERIATREALWADDNGQYAGFTMPGSVALADGSLGVLSIPAIGLTVGIYETDDAIESMAHGVAHLKSTSAWEGNVGLAGHNRGANTYFGRIHELKTGEVITLETSLGTRSYSVLSSKTIDEYDWAMLGRTEDNRVTLITCIDNQPSKRLCVQALEAVE